MDRNELADRTRKFAVRVFKQSNKFPLTQASRIVLNQLLRAASSVAANYRAVGKAKSRADFGNKLKIVLEEADECNFWLEFAGDIGIARLEDPEMKYLIAESRELIAIFSASVKTYNESKSSKFNF